MTHTNECRHETIWSCEKVQSHSFVRIGNNDKTQCPHCHNDKLLSLIERALPHIAVLKVQDADREEADNIRIEATEAITTR